jgi:hypothetical protein
MLSIRETATQRHGHTSLRDIYIAFVKRKKHGLSKVAHRLNVTLLRPTEEAAELFQLVSSGQYMT